MMRFKRLQCSRLSSARPMNASMLSTIIPSKSTDYLKVCRVMTQERFENLSQF